MPFCLTTDRLVIQERSEQYFGEYQRAFTDEITKYQWPEPFKNLASAKEVLSGFIFEMKEEKMLELVILSKEGKFMGSLETFNSKRA